ncbi:MAG TPA: hypothetical protein VHV74_18725, partial [Pseudonocardiaceae bacterium]|nr:hypothetical protein [Pseudonocardiaceae bacterium]
TSTAAAAAPVHSSMTGWFVLVTVILLAGAYLAVKHWKMTIAIAIVCPILLITYFATKIMAATGRT